MRGTRETQTQFGKNVVVGNLVYSLVLGMSVPDVSGAAIANLEVETLQHKTPDVPRRHDLRGDQSPRQARVAEQARPRGGDGRDLRLQPAGRRGLLLQATRDGAEARGREGAATALRVARGLERRSRPGRAASPPTYCGSPQALPSLDPRAEEPSCPTFRRPRLRRLPLRRTVRTAGRFARCRLRAVVRLQQVLRQPRPVPGRHLHPGARAAAAVVHRSVRDPRRVRLRGRAGSRRADLDDPVLRRLQHGAHAHRG